MTEGRSETSIVRGVIGSPEHVSSLSSYRTGRQLLRSYIHRVEEPWQNE